MNTSSTQFSVIIPCYNRVQFLKEAVDSVLEQTYQSFEIIIVDDGSDIVFASSIKKICDLDERIVYVKNDVNSGVSHARNMGLKYARGFYVLFLDDDDTINRTYFEIARSVMEKRPEIDISLYPAAIHPKSQESLFQYHVLKQTLKAQRKTPVFDKEHPVHLFTHPPQINSLIFKKEVFDRHVFDQSLQYGEDIYLWYQLLNDHFVFDKPLKVGPQAFVRVHGLGQLSQSGNQDVLDFLTNFRRELPKHQRTLQALMDFKIFMRHVLMKNYPKAVSVCLGSVKYPLHFLKALLKQGDLKFRITMSYLFYRFRKSLKNT